MRVIRKRLYTILLVGGEEEKLHNTVLHVQYLILLHSL